MANGKKKGKAAQKRKCTDSDKSLNPEKKPNKETPCVIANETKATMGSHVDENKTIEPLVKDAVEYLDTPTKSPYDMKEYRAIKLANGLKALLIAVPNIPRTEGEKEPESDDSDPDNPHAEFRPRDDRFEIGIRASCGLCIDVGKFSDPVGIPRVAEHLAAMISKESTKYPEHHNWLFEACSSARLKNIVGSDETIFTMTAVEESYLDEALDRMAQLFISSVMNRDDLPKIRESMLGRDNSMFSRDIESDLKESLFGSLARPGHPVRKLTRTGSDARRKITDDRLYKEIIKFKNRHYSAHRMTLVVEARLPLDTLEKYVKTCFSSIPTNDLPPDDFSKFKNVDPFVNSNFLRLYRMTSYHKLFNVELTWPMPPLHEHYRTKPHHYLARILQHQGEGSLFSYLEKKKLCCDISCRIGKNSFENNSFYTTLILLLQVTEKGDEYLWEVLEAVYSYIALLRKEGPQKRIYDEIQKVEEKKFRFRPKILNEDIFERCTRVRLYPPADCITGCQLYYEYDPEMIKACTDLLTPERATIFFHDSADNPWEASKSKPEFIKTSNNWIECWKTAAFKPELQLPKSNVFINEDYPVMIHADAFSEIWFQRHRELLGGESYMYIHYMTSLQHQSAENANMLNMFVLIFKRMFSTQLRLGCMIQSTPNGLWVGEDDCGQDLSFSMKTATIFITQFSHLLTEGLFDNAKKMFLESYCVDLKDPIKLARDLEADIKNPVHWTKIDLYSALRRLTFGKFRDFAKEFPRKMRIQCFFQGDMMTPDVIETVQRCVEILDCQPLSPTAILRAGTNKIPQGVRCCRVKSLGISRLESVVLNHYQFDASLTNLSIIIAVFCDWMNASKYVEQTNIVADCRPGQFGYSLTSGAITTKSTEEIDQCLELLRTLFFTEFVKKSENDLVDLKKDLIETVLKLTKINEDPETRARVHWANIMHEEDFNEIQRKLDFIDAMDIEDLRQWMLMLSMNHIRQDCNKLSIQVVGHHDYGKKNPKNNFRNDQKSIEYSLEYLTRLPKDKKRGENDYYIRDHKRFKDALTYCLKKQMST